MSSWGDKQYLQIPIFFNIDLFFHNVGYRHMRIQSNLTLEPMPVYKQELWLMLMYQCILKRCGEKSWIWLQIYILYSNIRFYII